MISLDPHLQKHSLLRCRRQNKVWIKPFQRFAGVLRAAPSRSSCLQAVLWRVWEPFTKGRKVPSHGNNISVCKKSNFISYPQRTGMNMNKTEQAYWRKFLETGQVTDYLHYRKHITEERENPRRRIEETSRNRKFY